MWEWWSREMLTLFCRFFIIFWIKYLRTFPKETDYFGNGNHIEDLIKYISRKLMCQTGCTIGQWPVMFCYHLSSMVGQKLLQQSRNNCSTNLHNVIMISCCHEGQDHRVSLSPLCYLPCFTINIWKTDILRMELSAIIKQHKYHLKFIALPKWCLEADFQLHLLPSKTAFEKFYSQRLKSMVGLFNQFK